jgi:hypothetical protein
VHWILFAPVEGDRAERPIQTAHQSAGRRERAGRDFDNELRVVVDAHVGPELKADVEIVVDLANITVN